MADFLYLASQSPRRRRLLEQLGVAYQLLLPEPHEDAESLEQVLPGEAPVDYVQRVTALKLDAAVARRARQDVPPAPILCADTTVALGSVILGKPADAADAQRILQRLAANTHQVHTAVALQVGGLRYSALSTSEVTFSLITPEQIAAYVASSEPMGKAGAYAIQGSVAQYVQNINGSYTGIMGLPLYETAQLLRAAAVLGA